MKLKLAEIVLKWPQNGMKTKVTHIRVEVSRVNSISFPYFELSHTIVTFPYKLLYLRYYAMSYSNAHGSQGYLWFYTVSRLLKYYVTVTFCTVS